MRPDRKAGELGLAAAKKAVELDGALPDAHAALGLSLFLDLKWADEPARSRTSRFAEFEQRYGAPLLRMVPRVHRALSESLEQMNLAQRLDPLSIAIPYTTAISCLAQGVRSVDRAVPSDARHRSGEPIRV